MTRRVNQRTRIKICGITSTDAAFAAVMAGADAIGLVFVRESPRFLSTPEAGRIAMQLPPLVEPIGVFADQPEDEIRRIAKFVGLRTIQLHGNEGLDEVEALRGLRMIKALPFVAATVPDLVEEWAGMPVSLCGLLWDAPRGKGTEPSGGLGFSFDWHQMGELNSAGAFDEGPPLILAGGLTPENVGEAIRIVRPFAVDVSSGVESSLGEKDPDLIHAFCRAVREADAD